MQERIALVDPYFSTDRVCAHELLHGQNWGLELLSVYLFVHVYVYVYYSTCKKCKDKACTVNTRLNLKHRLLSEYGLLLVDKCGYTWIFKLYVLK